MPNQSSFDLEKAISTWRAELARQPGLTPADLRELEAHLRDGFAELNKTPIHAEEAFLLARLRVGLPHPVASEFAKAAPLRAWAKPGFWLAFSFFALQIWQSIINVLSTELYLEVSNPHSRFTNGISPGILKMGDVLIYLMPLLVAWVWLVHGVPGVVAKLLATRERVTVVGLAMFLSPIFIRAFVMATQSSYMNATPWILDPMYFGVDRFGFGTKGEFFMLTYMWPLGLVALAVCLTPARAEPKAGPTLA